MAGRTRRAGSRDMTFAIATVGFGLVAIAALFSAMMWAMTDAPPPTPTRPPLTVAVAGKLSGESTGAAEPTPTASATPTSTPIPTATSTPSPTPTVTPTPSPSSTATPSVRKMTAAELNLLLRGHIEAQRAQFQDGRARFVPPDKVVISGRSLVRGQTVPVDATLVVGVDASARPRVLSYRLTINDQPAPPEAQAGLAARVAQTNLELDAAIPRDQRVKRVWTTNDAILAEFAD